jgi:hypothetical protein
MTVELRKLSVLEWVANLSDEQIINDLYESIAVKYKSTNSFDLSQADRFANIKHVKFDLEKVKEEQNYNGVDEKKMDQLISTLQIDQSIEELLNDLD